MKMKHNKKRNVAFLYEVLIMELAKSVKSKNEQLRSKIVETLKTFFNKDTAIGQELKIFKAIISTKNVNEIISEKILYQAKREHDLIDKNKLLQEQNNLFFKMKKILTPEALSNFVPNYKDLASIAQIFNKDISIKTRVLLENDILVKMSSNVIEESKMEPIDNLVLSSFIKSFNNKYKELHEEQKTLLNKYITSFIDNGLGLKVYLNEEIKRLKTEITHSLTLQEFIVDQHIENKGKEVLKLLESFSSKMIDEKMVSQVIKIQNLIREIKS